MTPSVQRAITSVGRQMKIFRNRPSYHQKKNNINSLKLTTTSNNSLFVSPLFEEIHSQVIESSNVVNLLSSSSSSEINFIENMDLSKTLHSFLHMKKELSSSSSSFVNYNMKESKKILNSKISFNQIQDALHLYNPTLDPTIVRRVADAINIEGTLKLAKKLVQAIQNGGDFKNLFSELTKLHQEKYYSMQELELQAGIATRLHHSKDGYRSSRLRGFRLYTSDVQVSEVLSNGKIITLTNPTLPGESIIDSGNSFDINNSYLHFVLYKEGISLIQAFNLLTEACEGACQVNDFAVNMALEESAVTVQLCSLYVSYPNNNNISCEKYRKTIINQLLRVNLRPLQINIQVLGWKSFPCDPVNSSNSQMQYSMLVRGITSGQIRLEAKVLNKLLAFPNFFGPRHFGSLISPFRSYHVVAAWERGMIVEAIMMAACLCYNSNENIKMKNWINKFIELVQQDEDRSAVLREWYHIHVPFGVKTQIAISKKALLWNIIASCRIHELGDSSLESSPDLGDFIWQKINNEKIHFWSERFIAKPELFPNEILSNLKTNNITNLNYNFQNVLPIFSLEEAAPFTIRDIIIPFNINDNDTIEKLAIELGFNKPIFKLEYSSLILSHFRPLFAIATGHPRTSRPWVKVLSEPNSILGENAQIEEGEEGVYKLLTDMELRQGKSYTSLSRGKSQTVWPITKYGYRLAERLPVGIISIAASDIVKDSTKCLALHFTLPASVYSMAFFREVMIIEEIYSSKNNTNTSLSGLNFSKRLSPTEEKSHFQIKEKEKKNFEINDISSDEYVDGDIMRNRK